MLTIDAHYASVVARLPRGLRAPARRLPHSLGLCASPEGGWEAFVELAPNRDLPAFAAEALPGSGRVLVDAPTLDRFREAHWLGGYHGLLVDRVLDRQAAATPALHALAEQLLAAWQRALAAATGDPAGSRARIDETLRQLRDSVVEEQRALGAGRLDAALYASLVRRKLQWIGVSAMALLDGVAPARRVGFQRAHDLLLVALQLVDDAEDDREDAARLGTSVAQALGVAPSALLRAAPHVCRAGAEAACAAGFGRLATWLVERAEAVACRSVSGDPLLAELGGLALALRIVDELAPGSMLGRNDSCG